MLRWSFFYKLIKNYGGVVRTKNLLIISILFFIGCGEKEPINFGQLKLVDNDYYSLMSNDKPYTGPIFNIEGKSEGFLKNGKFEGSFKFYNDNNQIIEEMNFKDGIENGPYKIYYDNQQLLYDGFLVNGEFDGEQKYYFKNGILSTIITFENGNLDGPFKSFSEQSILLNEGNLYFNYNEFFNNYTYETDFLSTLYPDELDYYGMNMASKYRTRFGDKILDQYIMLIDNPQEVLKFSKKFDYSNEVYVTHFGGTNYNRFKEGDNVSLNNLYVGNRKVYNNEGELIFEANYDSFHRLDGKVKYYIFHKNKDLYNRFYFTYPPLIAKDEGSHFVVPEDEIRDYKLIYKVDQNILPIDLYQMMSENMESKLIYINNPVIPKNIHNNINSNKENTFIEFTYKNGKPFDSTVLFGRAQPNWLEGRAVEFVRYEAGKPQDFSYEWPADSNASLSDWFNLFMYGEDDNLIKLELSLSTSYFFNVNYDDKNGETKYIKNFDYVFHYLNDKGEISGIILYDRKSGTKQEPVLIIDLENNKIESSGLKEILLKNPEKFKILNLSDNLDLQKLF